MAKREKFGNKFCVIGRNVRMNSGDRTWLLTASDAVEHAGRLLGSSSPLAPQELLIVKVIKVVRRASPPIEAVDVY